MINLKNENVKLKRNLCKQALLFASQSNNKRALDDSSKANQITVNELQFTIEQLQDRLHKLRYNLNKKKKRKN